MARHRLGTAQCSMAQAASVDEVTRLHKLADRTRLLRRVFVLEERIVDVRIELVTNLTNWHDVELAEDLLQLGVGHDHTLVERLDSGKRVVRVELLNRNALVSALEVVRDIKEALSELRDRKFTRVLDIVTRDATYVFSISEGTESAVVQLVVLGLELVDLLLESLDIIDSSHRLLWLCSLALRGRLLLVKAHAGLADATGLLWGNAAQVHRLREQHTAQHIRPLDLPVLWFRWCEGSAGPDKRQRFGKTRGVKTLFTLQHSANSELQPVNFP